jgi:hypothetical protein
LRDFGVNHEERVMGEYASAHFEVFGVGDD